MSQWTKVFAVLLVLVCASACTTKTVTGKGAIPEKTPDEQVALLVNAGTLYLTNKDPLRTKELMRRALEINPKSAEAHHLLAMAFWETLEYDLAETHFKKAIAYRSGYSQAHLNYSVLLYQQGRFKDAEKQVNASLEDSLYDQRARAFMVQGMILQGLQKDAEAVEAFRRSLALDRTNPAAMYGVAASSYAIGEYAQAERYYRQARENSKPSPESLILGIRIADKVGNLDAKGSFELALKNLFPDSPEAKAYFSGASAGQ